MTSTNNVSPFSISRLSQPQKYLLLDEYYENNELYNRAEIAYKLANNSDYKLEDMKPLRNPANRAIEFYAAKVANGKPKVVSNNTKLVDTVSTFLMWSNFEATRKEELRAISLYGLCFKKLVTTSDKVYQMVISPKDVTEYSEDVRGNITEIRIDTSVTKNDVGMTRTEFWTLEDGGYMAIWIHNSGKGAKLEDLGTPQEFAYLAEFGGDFIPIICTKFHRASQKYPSGALEHSLLKIDEVNRMATRLHQILFRYNKPLWAVSANATDKDGRPIPAPKIKNPTTGVLGGDTPMDDKGILYLPGNSSIDSLIPNIKYEEALHILMSQEDELKQDLPELIYYDLPNRDLSGLALRTILGSAVDRAIELETNYIQGQIRMDMMALTLGNFLGFFDNFGNFDNGDLLHELQFAEMFPLSLEEKARTLSLLPIEIPLAQRLVMAGYSKAEAESLITPSAGNPRAVSVPETPTNEITNQVA